MALCSSHRASHLARKLLEGVFKPETLINCTLTGMPARAQGKERQNRNVIALDFNGRTAIIGNLNQNYKIFQLNLIVFCSF